MSEFLTIDFSARSGAPGISDKSKPYLEAVWSRCAQVMTEHKARFAVLYCAWDPNISRDASGFLFCKHTNICSCEMFRQQSSCKVLTTLVLIVLTMNKDEGCGRFVPSLSIFYASVLPAPHTGSGLIASSTASSGAILLACVPPLCALWVSRPASPLLLLHTCSFPLPLP